MYRQTARATAAGARLAQVARHIHTSSPRARDAYILSAVRTPTGKFHGGLRSVPAPTLAATVIKEAVARSKVPPAKFTHAYLGNVLQASIGQSPARQAVILAGLPIDVEATTVNKVCASGLKSVVHAAQDVQLGLSEAVIAGGMENMSLVPRYMQRTILGYGDVRVEDGILKDGLTDVYNKFHMGNCAENTAKNLSITREDQDAYTIESYRRAKAAWDANAFADEIVPVSVPQKRGDPLTISRDEDYADVKLEKIPTLRPVFQKDGTVTAANASTLNDGASAIIVGSEATLEEFGGDSRVAAKIVSYADAAVDPIDFPLAPAKAIPIALERAGITKDDVALWELNEAFAAVSKALEKTLELDPKKVNVKGGAVALGHALGSSGSRILTTLLYQLEKGQYGVAAICNGGGGATAMVVQKLGGIQKRKSLTKKRLSWPTEENDYTFKAPIGENFETDKPGDNGDDRAASEMASPIPQRRRGESAYFPDRIGAIRYAIDPDADPSYEGWDTIAPNCEAAQIWDVRLDLATAYLSTALDWSFLRLGKMNEQVTVVIVYCEDEELDKLREDEITTALRSML
ncbi:hypothetical protein Dda_8834 [Drechslerella dactyloides]|uniref:acetyl-CoA C-acetyltransferase n=1 Tax=Drechslerella dactyloides TaxID=74499 RepID=A0AAD6ISV7_DREDA|nr:hypothetical protein Dda_8834 [Drechslerella dactyloides]